MNDVWDEHPDVHTKYQFQSFFYLSVSSTQDYLTQTMQEAT